MGVGIIQDICCVIADKRIVVCIIGKDVRISLIVRIQYLVAKQCISVVLIGTIKDITEDTIAVSAWIVDVVKSL